MSEPLHNYWEYRAACRVYYAMSLNPKENTGKEIAELKQRIENFQLTHITIKQ